MIKSDKSGKNNYMDKLFTTNIEDNEVYFNEFSDVETLRPKINTNITKFGGENKPND